MLARVQDRRGHRLPSDSVVAGLISTGVFVATCSMEPDFLNCADERPQIRFGRIEPMADGNLMIRTAMFTGEYTRENGAEIILVDVELRCVGRYQWALVRLHYRGAT